MILHEIRGQRIPRVAVLRISVNENNHRPLSSPTHEDMRCFRAVNGLCLKTGWQRRLSVTASRSYGEQGMARRRRIMDPPSVTVGLERRLSGICREDKDIRRFSSSTLGLSGRQLGNYE